MVRYTVLPEAERFRGRSGCTVYITKMYSTVSNKIPNSTVWNVIDSSIFQTAKRRMRFLGDLAITLKICFDVSITILLKNHLFGGSPGLGPRRCNKVDSVMPNLNTPNRAVPNQMFLKQRSRGSRGSREARNLRLWGVKGQLSRFMAALRRHGA